MDRYEREARAGADLRRMDAQQHRADLAAKNAEIERLTAERDRLREALEPFAILADDFLSDDDRDGSCIELFIGVGDLRRASALQPKKAESSHDNS